MTGEPDPAHLTEPADRVPSLDGLLRRASLAIVWERVWPPLATFGSVALVFLAVSWFGLWGSLPPLGRVIGILIFLALAVIALLPLRRFAIPERASSLARIDRASGHAHRPATALADPLANTAEDPVTRALWSVHRDRAAGAAKNLKSGAVRPGLAARDPRALRFAALLAALVAFVFAGEDRGNKIAAAFDWRGAAPVTVPPRLDAWVTPPPYTGRAPIFLTAAAQPDDPARAAVTPGDEPAHKVPAGSILVVRTSGGDSQISPGSGATIADDAEKAAPAPAAVATPATQPGVEIAEHRFTLEADTEVSVSPPSGDTRIWQFEVIPDAPPTIAFQAVPRLNDKGALVLDYNVGDDYGVTSAGAEVTRLRPPGPAKAIAERPLYGPPEVRLALPQGRARSGASSTTFESVEHPWAGARVLMTLVARDEPGQTGRSEALEAVLPARAFTHPLAKALVEQRRALALDAGARTGVSRVLEALTLYPEKFTPEAGVYLGLRSAYWRLAIARSDEDLRGVVDYLWEIALAIEEGDLPGLQDQLKAAEKALREALDRNAPDEELRKLMDELRTALNQFMQELARRMEQQPNNQAALPPNAQFVTPQDLQNMLDRMEQLARGGNRDAARDMLSDLSEMLDSLQNGQSAGQMDPGAEAQARALDELGRMIREQSELRDRTFQERQQGQQGQGQRGQQGQNQQGRGQPGEGQQPGQQGQGQQGQNGQGQGQGQQGQGQMGALGQQQGALRQRLQDLTRELEGLGMEGNQSLGDAGEQMGSAEGQLGEGDASRAFGSQGRALDALREGAQSMAQQMQSQGQGQGQGQGQMPGGRRSGPSAQQEDTDPLGRPTRSRRYDSGSTVRVPGEIEAQRARRVLEELRRRVGEPSRPQGEIDYLERLLRD